MWRATPYLERRHDYDNIPALRAKDNKAMKNADKTQPLIEIFFPPAEPLPPEVTLRVIGWIDRSNLVMARMETTL
jgi:hypothetical protein